MNSLKYFKSLIWIKATLKHLKVAMNQVLQSKNFSMFLLVAVETLTFWPIAELQAAAEDALRPCYAFFLFPAFPLLWNPLRCIATARDIVLVSLRAFRTVMYTPFYYYTGNVILFKNITETFSFVNPAIHKKYIW